MNPTLVGLFSVFVWGAALPFARTFEDRIGMLAYTGFMFSGVGFLGVLFHILRHDPLPGRAVFRNPAFYGRWFCFVFHEGGLLAALAMVQKQHVPFLILINYLWPTAVIACSILIAEVHVTRWWAFLAGAVIVVASLVNEVLGPGGFSPELFSKTSDCLAYGIVFAGAIAWGFYSALSRRAGDSAGGGSVMPLYQLTLAALLPVSFLPGFARWQNAGNTDFLFMALYCFLLFLAYLSWDFGMRKGNVVVISLCADSIPWISLFSAHFVLNVEITARTMVSAAALVLGAVVARYGTLKKTSRATYDAPGI